MPRPAQVAPPGHSLQHSLLDDGAWEERVARDLVPDQRGLIVAVDHFLSPDECWALVTAASSIGLQPPRPDDLRPKKGEAFLCRETLALVDQPLAARLWRRLLPLLPPLDGRSPVGLHGDVHGAGGASLLKFYRYRRGHSFGLHVDTSHKGGGPGEETEFTLLVYLNTQGEAVAGEVAGEAAGEEAQQPLVGGDTVFMRTAKAELCRVSPRAGVALLHAHGRRCCMHEAEEVRRGVKWVLRADVLYRRVDAAAPPPEAPLAAGAGAGGGRRRGKAGRPVTPCESVRENRV